MSDPRYELQGRFNNEGFQYQTFGNVLLYIRVQGIRCHKDTILEVKSPITALCGLNGVGKSTLLQLASVAYRNSNTQETRTVADFIAAHKFDPKPCTDNARVEFHILQDPQKFLEDQMKDKGNKDSKKFQQLTISRKSDGGWNGYRRRPIRRIHFIGIGSYLPKVEKSDCVVRYPDEIQVFSSNPITGDARNWICKILSRSYEQILSHEYTFRKRQGVINAVEKLSISYSEPHMGYGEARSQYLVRILEALPDKSLVLIEEPEISLHPSAQYQFGCYLVDVCLRKGHQIFLSTHSEYLLQSLPSQSRIYLENTENGVRTIEGLTAMQAHSLMTEGHRRALHILVEDQPGKSVAKAILCELIRTIDPTFLDCVSVHPVGDCNTVKNAVKALQSTGLSVAGVLDADQNPPSSESKDRKSGINVFALPGNNVIQTDRAPEKELFSCPGVKAYIQSQYNVNLDDFKTNLADTDHHEWFEKLADKLNLEESALIVEAARAYVRQLPETKRASLVDQLKAASPI